MDLGWSRFHVSLLDLGICEARRCRRFAGGLLLRMGMRNWRSCRTSAGCSGFHGRGPHIPCEHTCSPIIDIAISAPQLEHLMVGNKLETRIVEAMPTASSLPRFSQFEQRNPKARTCSPAANRLSSEDRLFSYADPGFVAARRC